MGDGIGGPVVRCISGNAFELDVTHYRKDNQEQYSRIEKIIISKIDNPENPEYKETTLEDLEMKKLMLLYAMYLCKNHLRVFNYLENLPNSASIADN